MGAVHARTATPRRQEDLLQSRATGWRLSPAAPMREQETVKQDVLGGAGEDPSPRVPESPSHRVPAVRALLDACFQGKESGCQVPGGQRWWGSLCPGHTSAMGSGSSSTVRGHEKTRNWPLARVGLLTTAKPLPSLNLTANFARPLKKATRK